VDHGPDQIIGRDQPLLRPNLTSSSLGTVVRASGILAERAGAVATLPLPL
jgi:hypothetical protein